jgi:hypothetical protein
MPKAITPISTHHSVAAPGVFLGIPWNTQEFGPKKINYTYYTPWSPLEQPIQERQPRNRHVSVSHSPSLDGKSPASASDSRSRSGWRRPSAPSPSPPSGLWPSPLPPASAVRAGLRRCGPPHPGALHLHGSTSSGLCRRRHSAVAWSVRQPAG